MHILGLLLGLIGAGVFWWYRLKTVAEVGNKALDAAGRVRSQVRRKRSRDKAAFAPVAAVDHPVIAAASLMRFVAGDEHWGRVRAPVEAQLGAIADGATVNEAMTYAEWVARQVDHEKRSIDALADKLWEWLAPTERAQLTGMLDEAMPMDDADVAARAARARSRLSD